MRSYFLIILTIHALFFSNSFAQERNQKEKKPVKEAKPTAPPTKKHSATKKVISASDQGQTSASKPKKPTSRIK